MIINCRLSPKQSLVIKNEFSNGDIVELIYSTTPDDDNGKIDIFWVCQKNLSEKTIPQNQRISSPEVVHIVKEGIQHIYIKNNDVREYNMRLDLHLNPVSPFFYFPSVSAASGF